MISPCLPRTSGNVSEDVIRSTALAIKEKGLLEAGYKYINL